MTLSGIIAGLSDSCGVACALSRVAAGMEANATAASRTPQADGASQRTSEQTPSVGDEARFDTTDRVELSSQALGEQELTDEEQERVQELQQRDAEVRQHEQAHLSAAGQYASGGAQFEYTTGPDGKRYATGGEVQIDVTAVANDPDATIQKMETVRAAALAPSQPSSQDRRVAASAAVAIRKAQVEKTQQSLEQMGASSGESAGESTEPAAMQSTSDGNMKQYTSSGTAVASGTEGNYGRLDMHA